MKLSQLSKTTDRTQFRIILGGILLLFSACATPRPINSFESDSNNPSAKSRSHPSNASHLAKDEKEGKASWYGRRFHHRKTASGERFNMYDYTAAHRNLPFGSKIRIRNLKSGKTVVVRVNDRGPASKSRLVDVSYAAGKALGLVSSGVAPVEIEIVKH